MKILVLSFYYEPDLCAGSFRCTSLINELSQIEGVEIDIVTTLPNRYASFDAEAPESENKGNVNIKRIALPSHQSGMLDQIKSFHTYYKKAKAHVKSKNYDLVFATSSRLFTAYLGAVIAKNKNIPLYLDIRDIFVDTIKDVLPGPVVFWLKPILRLIENYAFKKARHINLVSEGFDDYFRNRFLHCSYSYFTNGIDSEFLNTITDSVNKSDRARIRILYAGNMGEGQGLHSIIPELAVLAGDKYEFMLVGDGGRKPQLLDAVRGVNNVKVLDPVKRQELLSMYMSSDVLFLHLNDYPAFKKVLPSKIFEYAATGKPILAGVAGYPAKFLTSEVDNVAVFPPCDANAASKALQSLSMDTIARMDFVERFKRENIMKEMAKSIVSQGRKNG